MDNSKHLNESVQDNVRRAIASGNVTMRSRWYFVANAVLLIIGTMLVALTLLYIGSFIIFILHQTGVWFIPSFGMRGLREFLIALPWLLILLTLLFIVILEVLIKKYAFVYNRPLLYSVAGIIFFVAFGGFALTLIPFHSNLFRQAQRNNLPFAGRVYRLYGMPSYRGRVIPGAIVEIINNGYRITTPRNETITVALTPATVLIPRNGFGIGDEIVALGDWQDDIMVAFGIRRIQTAHKE